MAEAIIEGRLIDGELWLRYEDHLSAFGDLRRLKDHEIRDLVNTIRDNISTAWLKNEKSPECLRELISGAVLEYLEQVKLRALPRG